MWDVHALVEQGAVLGRSRRDGRGEGVLIVQTYSREHSNWVALRCGGLALLHIVEQGPRPKRRRRSSSPGRRLLDGVKLARNLGGIWCRRTCWWCPSLEELNVDVLEVSAGPGLDVGPQAVRI